MPTISTRSQEQEYSLYFKTKVEELKSVYAKAQENLKKELQRVDITDFGRARAQSLLRQVNQQVDALNKKVYKWSKDTMPKAYERGIDLAAANLKELGVTRFISYGAQVHTSAVGILIDDVALDMISVNEQMAKDIKRFVRQTQQKAIEDAQISRLLAQGLLEGEARKKISDKVYKQLKERMLGEKFIRINGKNYDPDKYARLVARTRIREATTTGVRNTALQYGVDLVQISTHADSCEYCKKFQGKVYSLSGKSKDFPVLEEQPPYHPNCEHVLMPTTEEAMQARGEFEGIKKLSNSSVSVDSYRQYRQFITTGTIDRTSEAVKVVKPNVEDVITKKKMFTPATTVEEAEKMIKDNYADMVSFPGIDLKSINSIAEGLDKGLFDKIAIVSWKPTKSTANAYFSRPMFGYKPGANDRIAFKKSYVKNSKKVEAKTRAAFDANKNRNTERLQKIIADKSWPEISRDNAMKDLEVLNNTKRWTVASTSKDPLLVTAAHESGHAVYYQNQLKPLWEAALIDNKISRLDRYGLSEYAASDMSELFAETHSAVVTGQENIVPEKLLKAYKQTIGRIK